MRRLAFLVIAWLAAAVTAQADLRSEIRDILQDKMLRRATVGVEIVRLGASADRVETIFAQDDKTPLVPASNLKLVTTSAALEKLGAAFHFRTVLLLTPEGDLAVIGGGDPTLGDTEFLRKSGWNSTTVFNQWAEQLKRRNVASVGDIRIDDSVYDENFVHPHWPVDQLHKRYEAGVGGLNLNANCVDFLVQASGVGAAVQYSIEPPTQYVSVRNTCVGGSENAVWLSRQANTNDIILRGQTRGTTPVSASVTIHDPPLFAGTVLAETLRKQGITLRGSVKRDRTIRAAREKPGVDRSVVIAIHETPLDAVLGRTNKDSMNLYAESLCKRLGFERTGQPGSWENGTATVAAFLKEIGVESSEFRLDDGCGLSKENAISAHALTRVLMRDYYGRNRQVFMDSLSVGGVDGTLEDRFRNDLRGRVFGKSGYVTGVRALSGYLHTKNDQWFAFSILMNKANDGGVKQLQEKILQAVDAHASALAAGER